MQAKRGMLALQRLVQKSLNMEVKFILRKLHLRASDINEGKPFKLLIQIVRGPVTWRSREYEVREDCRELIFNDDEFCKKSGVYFKKDGAEIKKASFSFIMVGSEDDERHEEVITQADINLSHFIGFELVETHIQVSRNNITQLEFAG